MYFLIETRWLNGNWTLSKIYRLTANFDMKMRKGRDRQELYNLQSWMFRLAFNLVWNRICRIILNAEIVQRIRNEISRNCHLRYRFSPNHRKYFPNCRYCNYSQPISRNLTIPIINTDVRSFDELNKPEWINWREDRVGKILETIRLKSIEKKTTSLRIKFFITVSHGAMSQLYRPCV